MDLQEPSTDRCRIATTTIRHVQQLSLCGHVRIMAAVDSYIHNGAVVWACSQCHEMKGGTRDNDTHIYKEESIATARFLHADTKHCPSCGAPVFKIEGCDQVFCTQCHTAFSWNTGRAETGTIHNPHYMRRSGHLERNPEYIPCNRHLGHALVLSLSRRLDALVRTKNHELIVGEVETISRNLTHVNHVDLPRFKEGCVCMKIFVFPICAIR
jgi:ribosomal protein S27AE